MVSRRRVPHVAAIVPAAGWGRRLGAGAPKAFVALGGQPMVARTLSRLLEVRAIRSAVVAVPAARVASTRRRLHRLGSRIRVVEGGRERQESVARALPNVAREADLILVHDAARPLVPRPVIERVVRVAWRSGAALAAMRVPDTLKRVRADGAVASTVDREGLWLAQTPQCFRAAWLVEGHRRALRDGVRGTDDAALVERLGHRVRVVEGSPWSFKITTREDLRLARAALKAPSGGAGR